MKSCLICWCLSLLVIACQGEPAPADAMSRPARPKSFASPDDLRLYLDRLGQYYAVAGRPRFGKRTSSHPQRYQLPLDGVNYRYVPEPSEIYDLLYQPLADN